MCARVLCCVSLSACYHKKTLKVQIAIHDHQAYTCTDRLMIFCSLISRYIFNVSISFFSCSLSASGTSEWIMENVFTWMSVYRDFSAASVDVHDRKVASDITRSRLELKTPIDSKLCHQTRQWTILSTSHLIDLKLTI